MKALRVIRCLFFFLGSFIFSCAQLPGDAIEKLSGIAMLLPQHRQSDVSGPAFTLDEVERMALAGIQKSRSPPEGLPCLKPM